MKKFVGIIILMGLVRLPAMHLYWSKSNLYGVAAVRSAMTRDRFFLLLRFWHFADNTAATGDDRLYRLRPLLDCLNFNFRAALDAGREIVIDESMVPWRGRLLFRQYLPGKAHKYGVKLFKACTKDGFTLNLDVYAGRADRDAGVGLSEAVVRRLADHLLDKGRIVYADNFYTSVPLATYLIGRNTHLCGTVRSNRKGLPTDVTKAKVKKGEVVGRMNADGVKVLQWTDKRSVFMLSTIPGHSTALVDVGRARRGQPVMKPQAVLDYNRNKRGVDSSDQFSSYYPSLRKTLRWYKKVAMELVAGTALVNAWLLHCEQHGFQKTLLQFREAVARELIDAPEAPMMFQPGSRRLVHAVEVREGPNSKTRKRCTSCYQRARAAGASRDAARAASKRVNTFCGTCPKSPTMCLDCFNKNHMNM